MEMFQKEKETDQLSLFRRSLMNKYPQQNFKKYQRLGLNLENLKKNMIPKPIIAHSRISEVE